MVRWNSAATSRARAAGGSGRRRLDRAQEEGVVDADRQQAVADQQALEETKSDIGWGSQIRSYVLDQSRIKDLRTGIEVGNTQAVLDGGLDPFIEASLKSGL